MTEATIETVIEMIKSKAEERLAELGPGPSRTQEQASAAPGRLKGKQRKQKKKQAKEEQNKKR